MRSKSHWVLAQRTKHTSIFQRLSIRIAIKKILLTIPSPILLTVHGTNAVDPVCDVIVVPFSVSKFSGGPFSSTGAKDAVSSLKSSPIKWWSSSELPTLYLSEIDKKSSQSQDDVKRCIVLLCVGAWRYISNLLLYRSVKIGKI